jgi:hypothetical protein
VRFTRFTRLTPDESSDKVDDKVEMVKKAVIALIRD